MPHGNTIIRPWSAHETLNVRTAPNGTILGALNNGTRVSVLNVITDRSGERWALITPLGPGKRGYVFRSFLDC
jgi:hypothetical protein